MILTCPECATSYFVDDARIPPEGRRVKCSSCEHRWKAGPDGPMTEEPPAPEPRLEPESPAAEAPAPEPAGEPPPVFVPLRRPPAGPARRAARSGVLVWAVAAAVAAAVVAGVLVFREQIVRLWPQSSMAYAGLGLPVEGGGLVFEQVRAQPAFLAGRPVLSVSGAIRNVRDAQVNTPAVRVTLLNRAGQPVAAKIARPEDPAIPARATRHFVITLLDPPASARDLEVRFDTGAAAARPAEAVLAPAPAPLEATPAPATTPAAAVAAPVTSAEEGEHG